MWARCPVCERRLSASEFREAERREVIRCSGCGSDIGIDPKSIGWLYLLVGLAVAAPVLALFLARRDWVMAAGASGLTVYLVGRLMRQVPIGRMEVLTIAEGRCGKCGYDMTGLKSERCPECGAGIVRRARDGARGS